MLLGRIHSKRQRVISAVLFAAIVTLILIAFAGDLSVYVLKSAYPLKYQEYVYQYSYSNGLDPYLVFAVIKAESSFNPRAISNKNARGLMQLTEKTADWGAKSLNMEQFQVESLYNPDTNIKIGCWYLSRLMREFNNNVDLVIAAYNGGSGNVSQWLKDKALSNTGNSLERIPFKETERFVKRVKNYQSVYKRLYEKAL